MAEVCKREDNGGVFLSCSIYLKCGYQENFLLTIKSFLDTLMLFKILLLFRAVASLNGIRRGSCKRCFFVIYAVDYVVKRQIKSGI